MSLLRNPLQDCNVTISLRKDPPVFVVIHRIERLPGPEDSKRTERSVDILVSLAEASNGVLEDLHTGQVQITVGSTTVTFARSEALRSSAKAVVTINQGSTAANEAAGLALQNSGKYSCSSEQDGTVRCERN